MALFVFPFSGKIHNLYHSNFGGHVSVEPMWKGAMNFIFILHLSISNGRRSVRDFSVCVFFALLCFLPFLFS